MTAALILAMYRRARSRGFSRGAARRMARQVLGTLGTVTLLVTAGCAPEPRVDPSPSGLRAVCNPNHSGVCEGPPVYVDPDVLRRIQARDTTNGRNIEL